MLWNQLKGLSIFQVALVFIGIHFIQVRHNGYYGHLVASLKRETSFGRLPYCSAGGRLLGILTVRVSFHRQPYTVSSSSKPKTPALS